MAHVTIDTPHTAGLIARLFHALDDVKTRYAKYRTFRATLADMQTLSDRELDDLGLSRSMIRRCAYEAAYG